ncbi:MAG: hypothetical protein R3Y57_03225 [Erysipelotrichaceae bacterium]
MNQSKSTMSKSMILFFILVAFIAVGKGLSDSIFSNYYKEVYSVTATQRAFIEFPRELPGVLCALIIASLSSLGNLKIALFAQILSCIGITALGFFTPSFAVMLIFLFVNSTGMHLFMPLQDSIIMELAEKDKVGQRVGQLASLSTAIAFLTAIVVYVGFSTGFFYFSSTIQFVFIISAIAFFGAIIVNILLIKQAKKENLLQSVQPKKFKLTFRKDYKFYYLLTILHGVQKQIAYVFGSWVIIDLLLKGADIMSLLGIISSFFGIFFMQKIGKWIDSKGIRFMMYLDALTFIIIYTLYGFVVWGIADTLIPSSGWPVVIIYGLFILDRLSMQIGVVKSVYLKKIAHPQDDIASILSTGISLDHIVSIIAAQISGYIWVAAGPQWVFFFAAFISFGNLFVAKQIKS